MKTKLLSVIAFFAATAVIAQITVTDADVVGVDKVVYEAIDTMPAAAITAGSAGANQTWDFSALVEHETDTLNFTNPNWTPYASDYPTSNLCVEFEADSFYIYLEKNTSGLYFIGQAGNFGFGVMKLKFNPTQRFIAFPLTYNNTYQDTSVMDFSFDPQSPPVDSVRSKTTTYLDVNVDAWGSVTTPLGTFNAIRLNETEAEIDSQWIMIAGMWQLDTVEMSTTYSYSWWTDDNAAGFPLVEGDYSSGTNDFNGSVSYLKATPSTSIYEDGLIKTEVRLYPNPVKSYANFHLDASIVETIEILDITGKRVESIPIARDVETINVEQYPYGIYFYRAIGKNGQSLYTGKLTVIK
ncbi:MAG: hypothetical protein COA57_12600 [Flavobacteriales bacterium]|nr:MAG: hypothetical protein COA57_12600 [Flavobacteriales bacterium]